MGAEGERTFKAALTEPSGSRLSLARRRGKEAHVANPKEIVERGTKLFNAHDVNGLTDLYAPNAQVLASGGMVAKGRDEIRKFQQSWFQDFRMPRSAARG
jgi:ketosteroid isomerase-like protein